MATSKYQPINWVDGMKITKEHLLGSDLAAIDAMKEIARTHLNSYTYGLLPAGDGNVCQLIQNGNELSLPFCKAVTPGGVRIDFPVYANQPPLTCSLSSIQNELLNDRSSEFYVLLIVDPTAVVPFGEPNPQETPLRLPHWMPSLRLAVATAEHIRQNPSGLHHLVVGKLRKVNQQFNLLSSGEYVPPCINMAVHPTLAWYYDLFDALIGQIDKNAETTVQNVYLKAQDEWSKNVGILAQKVVLHIADSYDNYRLILNEAPPAHFVAYFARFARVFLGTLRCLPQRNKEYMYNYFGQRFGVTQATFESKLNMLVKIQYNHNDVVASFAIIKDFLDNLNAIFNELSGLEYVYKGDTDGGYRGREQYR
ncbi:hypothetical protein [Runella zeae]|uniref:hypothetical protein n=1 Tax=Runella zeae TaxID=94255 RepID=UPI000407B755|nr:hypothetical protein [Runella zeae]